MMLNRMAALCAWSFGHARPVASSFKRVFVAVIAIAYGVTWGGAPAAQALNTNLVIGLCPNCSKTADYEAAAWSLISSQTVIKWPGNYDPITYTAIMSNNASSTAFIKLSGSWGISARHIVFVAQTFTPVDANGNSLAGQSEAYLENFYTQMDWSIFDIFRADPTAVTLPTVDFESDTDTDISTQIADAQVHDVVSGTAVTVTFTGGYSRGDTAVYLRTDDKDPSDHAHWYVWTHVAHNAPSVCQKGGLGGSIKVCGGPIDHKGTLLIPINTSGTIRGSVVPDPGYYLYPTPPPDGTGLCSYSSYTEVNGETFGSTGFGPC